MTPSSLIRTPERTESGGAPSLRTGTGLVFFPKFPRFVQSLKTIYKCFSQALGQYSTPNGFSAEVYVGVEKISHSHPRILYNSCRRLNLVRPIRKQQVLFLSDNMVIVQAWTHGPCRDKKPMTLIRNYTCLHGVPEGNLEFL